MLDIDLACPDCLREAVERRFLYYPNHLTTRVTKLSPKAKEHCTICRGTGAIYSISIQINSLDMAKVEKEREMILEARRNTDKVHRGIRNGK
jgi:hypothetical protein